MLHPLQPPILLPFGPSSRPSKVSPSNHAAYFFGILSSLWTFSAPLVTSSRTRSLSPSSYTRNSRFMEMPCDKGAGWCTWQGYHQETDVFKASPKLSTRGVVLNWRPGMKIALVLSSTCLQMMRARQHHHSREHLTILDDLLHETVHVTTSTSGRFIPVKTSSKASDSDKKQHCAI